MKKSSKTKEALLLELNTLKQENAILKSKYEKDIKEQIKLKFELENSITKYQHSCDSINDTMKLQDEQNIRQLFDNYLQMYSSRDDNLTTYFSDNFSGFTGGGDFLVKDKAEWIAITRQDFAQVKDPIHIELKDLSIQSLSETIAVATSFFTIQLPIKDEILSREIARLVLIFCKETNGWKISHSSISIPYHLVRDGEIYPMKELVDRNQFLEELVVERTKQLSEANDNLKQTNEILTREIVEHKQTAEAQRESEQKYHQVVDRANEAIVVVQGGMVRLTNPMTRTMTGYSETEIETTPFQLFIHPDDRTLVVENHLKRLRGEYVPSYYIFRLLNKEGNTRWVYMNAVLIDWEGSPATLNFLTDITERKLAEEALQQSNQKLEAIISASPDGIGMISIDGKMQFFSDKLFKMHGYSIEDKNELIGKSALDFIDPSNHKMLQDNISKLLTGESDYKIKEYLAVKKDNTRFYIEINYTVLNDSEGNPLSILFVERDSTERKLTEEALQQSNQKWEAIISVSPDGIGMASLDGKIQLISEKLVKMHGYSFEQKDQFIDKPIFDFIDPADHNLLKDNIRKLLSGTNDKKLTEYLAIKNDNSRFNIDVNARILFDSAGNPKSILYVERDITERKIAEEALQKSNQKLEAIISASPDGIGMISLDGKMQLMSDKLAEMYGYSIELKEEFIGKSVLDFIDPSNHKILLDNIHKLIAGENDNKLKEYLAIKKDNSRFYIDVNSTVLLDSNGNPENILFIERDITERKQNELIIQQQNNQLQELNATKDKFFSIIAHDLRSPFQGFIGITQLMADDITRFSLTELSNLTKGMNNSANNLYKLLLNLLEWARMQQDAVSFNPVEIVLSEIVTQNIDLIIKRGEQKGIDIISEIPLNQKVYADEAMLNTILRNLLSNAVKFTKQGGKIVVRSNQTENNTVEISVTDSGIGMSLDLCNKLFKMEEKVGRIGTEGEESTGLGLLLCKEFVEKHNGSIHVESKENEGSKFTFSLPGK
ncbi:MAG: PAS domain S-box protein [Ignavibacteriales bacterium]|nr:PAS domain S-box protein [Ignavibacteriales bacterium]